METEQETKHLALIKSLTDLIAITKVLAKKNDLKNKLTLKHEKD